MADYDEGIATEMIEAYVKEHSQHTIGVEFSSRTINIGEKRVKLQVSATDSLVLFSWTHRASFLSLSRWLADARALASPQLITVLVGNKTDKEEEREVEWSEASKWAAENDVHFIETSSLTGDNIEKPFALAARAILLSIESGQLDPEKAR
ncbi:Rab-related GTPase family protein [Ceratobasidium theobromae]|uniref:Rab-related GTPase family protein n=1 Tax=Ceratobasidium theobromae TaxID=1582974 RepID=A0A5N5QG03_9AGAM|nr:Rab-related GTPase family protein [Ceratobasidium theobromae]